MDKNVARPAACHPQRPEALSRDAEPQTTPERRGKKDLKDLQVARKLEAPPAVDTREREMTSQYLRSESAPAPERAPMRRWLPGGAVGRRVIVRATRRFRVG